MKKYLIPEKGEFYKANLHCHTTVSDGRRSPEEIKALYKKLGYSVVAYTDHDIFIPHNDLTDDTFLALNGFEMEVNEPGDAAWNTKKCCHVCYVALDKDTEIQPMYNEAYLFKPSLKYRHLVRYDKNETPYERRYTGDGIGEMMKKGRDAGFFVTYNHPTWSRETYPEYTSYHGMHAMEMFNGGCIVEGYDDYNPRVYDDILSAGERIYCIGTDDNHNRHEDLTRDSDSGIAYTVIKASRLEYKAVTDALLAGNFYCSDGPSIDALWTEDGNVYIECSEADSIAITYQIRRGGVVFTDGKQPLTKASFPIDREWGYFRITVTDKQGHHACTNAYFLD